MEDSNALIALLVVLLGVLLGKGLEAAIERRRRWNREIDMVFALHAEIAASQNALRDQCQIDQARLFLAEEEPAGPSGSADFVFQSLKGDLSLLPQSVIHQTVLYYRLAEETTILLGYLATDAYKALPSDRKQRFRLHAMNSIKDQLSASSEALDTLDTAMRERGFLPPGRSRIDSDQGRGFDSSDEGTDRAGHSHSP